MFRTSQRYVLRKQNIQVHIICARHIVEKTPQECPRVSATQECPLSQSCLRTAAEVTAPFVNERVGRRVLGHARSLNRMWRGGIQHLVGLVEHSENCSPIVPILYVG